MFKSQCHNLFSSALFYNFNLLKSNIYNDPLFWGIIEPDREEGKVRTRIQVNTYAALNNSAQIIFETSALKVNSDSVMYLSDQEINNYFKRGWSKVLSFTSMVVQYGSLELQDWNK